MDLSMIGSVHTYAKNLEMQAKFNQKKDSGSLGSHPASEIDLIQQQVDEEHKNDRLKDIMRKVEAGSRLTEDEKAYLKAKDPETYQELEAREREQKAYEQALKRCKTKEDVQRLKASKLGASMTKLKAVENDPHITPEKKLKIFTDEKLKMDKFEESTRKFVRSGEMAKLPTEAEKAKVEKEEREAKKTSREPSAEKPSKREDRAAEPASKEKTSEHETQTPATQRKYGKRPDFKQESPEARKVRRAKAKAAYTLPEEPPAAAPAVSLDTKG